MSAYRCGVLVVLASLISSCALTDPRVGDLPVRITIVRGVGVGFSVEFELRLDNDGASPLFVSQCPSVERRVSNGKWIRDPRLSEVCTAAGTERIDPTGSISRWITLDKVLVLPDGPGETSLRFTFTVGTDSLSNGSVRARVGSEPVRISR